MHDVDTRPVEDERIVLDEQFEIELPCDGPRIWPERIRPHNTPAKWIGLKTCGHHRLLCGDCKEFYLNLLARSAGFGCAECGDWRDLVDFIGFELINKARM